MTKFEAATTILEGCVCICLLAKGALLFSSKAFRMLSTS